MKTADENMKTEREKRRGDLLVDLLQESNLFLQRLDASLQVQTSQSGSVHILHRFGESFKKHISRGSPLFIISGVKMSIETQSSKEKGLR